MPRAFSPQLLLACLGWLACPAITMASTADEPTTAQQELPRGVVDFCERAAARDRGVVNNPFAGPTDGRLAVAMVLNKPLRQRMQLSASQIRDLASIVDDHCLLTFELSREEFTKHATRAAEESKPAKGQNDTAEPKAAKPIRKPPEPIDLYHFDEGGQEAISRVLTDKQRDQLDLLYLNADGLMALPRQHLKERLSLSRAQQQALLQAIHKAIVDDALEVHRAYFSAVGEEATTGPPLMRRELLRQSLRVDRALAAQLTAKQLEQLAPILKEALEWEKFVIGPGLAGAIRAKDVINAGKE